MDSNSGGEIRRPETAVRTGPKASRGFTPRPFDEGLLQGSLDGLGGPVREGLQGSQGGVEDFSEVFRQALAGVVGDVDRVVGLEQERQHLRASPRSEMRSWISGAASARISSSRAVRLSPTRPAACR